jgi:cell division protein FtsA
VGKQNQRLGDMYHGGIIDLDNVLENVEEAVREAEKMAGVTTEQMVVGIAGEYVRGATTTVEYTREAPQQKITMSELKNIVHKMQWKAFEDVRKQLAWETGYPELDIKLVHAAIVDVRIDGYKISNPLGFKGKNVSLSIFNAFAPLVHYETMRSIARGLDKELLAVLVEPYAVSRCLGFEDGSDFSAIFVDIGGGTTDVALVQNGGIVGTRMYTVGGRVFTKRIARHMNLLFKDAEKLKLRYANNQVDPETKAKIDAFLKHDIEVWTAGLALALEDFPHVEVLPSKILLCGGGACLPALKTALEERSWYETLPFSRTPHASFIRPEDVYNLEDKTGRLCTQQDITPMALGNVALSLGGRELLLPRLLAQVSRMMSA